MEDLVAFRCVGFFFAPPTGVRGHGRSVRPVCLGALRMEKFTMRHTMTGSRNVQSNGVVGRHRFTLKGVSALLAVAGVMALAPAFAKDPAAAEDKPTGKGPAIQARAHADSVAIPECLEKLKLSAAQQSQVKEIVTNYDRSTGVVWKQFSDRYMQAIRMTNNAEPARCIQVPNLLARIGSHVCDLLHFSPGHFRSAESNNQDVEDIRVKG